MMHGSMTDSRCCLSNGFHAPQSLCDSSPILEEQLSTLSPDTNDLLSSSIVKLFESIFLVRWLFCSCAFPFKNPFLILSRLTSNHYLCTKSSLTCCHLREIKPPKLLFYLLFSCSFCLTKPSLLSQLSQVSQVSQVNHPSQPSQLSLITTSRMA